MGTRGPMPKENARRRNAESQPHVVDGARVEPLPLPDSYRWLLEQVSGTGRDRTVELVEIVREFDSETVEYWRLITTGQLAAEYRPEMVPALHRLVVLYDRWVRGDHSVNVELRAMEKEFALTWSTQKRERLKFDQQQSAAGSAAVGGGVVDLERRKRAMKRDAS